MFTGIIKAIGTLKKIEQSDQDRRLQIDTGKLDLVTVDVGDSISVNGVCLTVVTREDDGIVVDVSNETLSCTNLGLLVAGDHVNLEPALTLSDKLDGHLVSGHVDATAAVVSITPDDRSVQFVFETEARLMKYIAVKGSICIDGVSLTINQVDGNTFKVNIIPHTIQETTFAAYVKGTRVNIEVDLVARYLEGLIHKA